MLLFNLNWEPTTTTTVHNFQTAMISKLNMRRLVMTTTTKRKRREWLPLLFTFVVCLSVCSWRMLIQSEPDLSESGKKAGLIGPFGHLNALPFPGSGSILGYFNGNDGEDVTKAPVYTRHVEVKERCQRLEDTRDLFEPGLRFPFSPYISFEPKTFFCPVPKCGSTFFTRYFLTVQQAQNDPDLSPLNFTIESASRSKQLPFSILKEKEDKDNFMRESTKTIFTRHPYARLFSAYIDKLYAPNPFFWRNWGVNAIRFFNITPLSDHPCGSFVSFPHFIQLVIKGLWKRDPHVMPMDELCHFCEVKYDVIGKLETVTTDVDFLSEKLKVSGAFIHDKNFKDYFTEDAIKDSTKDPLTTWREHVSGCVSDFVVGRLIWRKLQIRGFIDANIPFPFNRKKMASVSLEEFRQACFSAVEKSNDKERLKRQKQTAFEEAFQLIPDDHFIKLQKIYERDFSLLDYNDKRPSLYVPGLKQENVLSLNWKTKWSL